MLFSSQGGGLGWEKDPLPFLDQEGGCGRGTGLNTGLQRGRAERQGEKAQGSGLARPGGSGGRSWASPATGKGTPQEVFKDRGGKGLGAVLGGLA